MLKSATLAVLALTALPAFANPPVIYGDDNRQEVYEATPMNQKLAASAAAMVDKAKISRADDKPGVVQIEQKTLRQWLEAQFEEEQKSNLLSLEAKNAVDQKISFCEGERFTEQPNAGTCSGFLVGPDLLVTAGHCVEVPNMCETYSWVFDFKVDEKSQTAGVDVSESNVYNCKRVISHALSAGLGLDYGLIQLDRKVVGRESLTIRSEGQLPSDSKLVVIGHPSGLPMKVAGGAAVRTNNKPFYFSANLDTFQGNSGSAVFNADSGIVEGILVRGEEDFEANMSLMCIEAKRCDDSGCRGEDVSRMTSIPEYGVKDALFKIAAKGDTKELEKITKTKFWIDIYGKDGKTALITAVENKRTNMIDPLIAKGADVKISDVNGNTVLHALASFLTSKNSASLKSLTDAGSVLEAKNVHGETALLVAAKSLNLEAVKILIKSGADKNAADKKNETALFAFARKGDKKAVKELTALGVDTSVRNADGQTIEDLKKPGIFNKITK